MNSLGYVVVEFNQASGEPCICSGIYNREDAEDVAAQRREETALVGRRERYAVALVIEEEEED